MLVLLLVYHGCSMQPGRSGLGITTLSPSTCENWINNAHAITSCYEYFAPRKKYPTIQYIICVLQGRKNHWDLLGDWCGQRILKGLLTICQPVLVLPHSTQKLLHLPFHLNDENCATSRMVSTWIRHLWTGRLNVAHKLSVVLKTVRLLTGVVRIKWVEHW